MIAPNDHLHPAPSISDEGRGEAERIRRRRYRAVPPLLTAKTGTTERSLRLMFFFDRSSPLWNRRIFAVRARRTQSGLIQLAAVLVETAAAPFSTRNQHYCRARRSIGFSDGEESRSWGGGICLSIPGHQANNRDGEKMRESLRDYRMPGQVQMHSVLFQVFFERAISSSQPDLAHVLQFGVDVQCPFTLDFHYIRRRKKKRWCLLELTAWSS